MNSSSLENIDLSLNQLEGPLPHWSIDAARYLDLSSNFFSGPMPSNYGQLMYGLFDLNLSDNQLNGSIPPSLCSMADLSILLLRNNHLSGEFPHLVHLGSSCWLDIWVVDVSDNNLSGNLPSSLGVSTSLYVLNLSKNNFKGQIPSSLFQLTGLRSLDLGGNRFTGSIPLWTRSYAPSGLSLLRLRSNFLTGHIPHQLCSLQSLHIIDFGHNNFSGTIPECLYNLTVLAHGEVGASELSSLYYQETASLTLKGQEYVYNRTLDLVNTIDFSSNNLEGEIPEGISSLIALGTLNLSRNHLTGNIPSKIGNIRWLETLDLSHNHLSGKIPQSLSSLSSLSHLNLSHNNLSGRIPSGNQLQTLNDSSIYEGNPLLCGHPLSTLCEGDGTLSPTAHDDDDDDWKLGMYVCATLGFIIGFWSVFGTLVLKKSWRYAYFQFFDNIKDKVALAIALTAARWHRRRS